MRLLAAGHAARAFIGVGAIEAPPARRELMIPGSSQNLRIAAYGFDSFLDGAGLNGAMSQIQSAPPICPKCHKMMKLMLTKGERQRVLRCADCGQPDPMQNSEAQGWLKGELGPTE